MRELVPIEYQPSDPELLRHAFYGGMEAKYMEFIRWTPEAKHYRDNVSGRILGLFRILPDLDDNNNLIDAKWYEVEPAGERYHTSGKNRFHIEVKGLAVKLVCTTDKAFHHRRDQWVEWNPQIFLNGEEIICPTEATLLSQNENRPNSILEWDYSICKRRLRIIEGAILESYIFERNPEGDIEIRSNAIGDLVPEQYWARDSLGTYLEIEVEAGVKHIAKKQFAGRAYPVEIDDSDIFYSTTSDGIVMCDVLLGEGWAACHDAEIGTAVNTTNLGAPSAAEAFIEEFIQIHRSFFYFDTSSIGLGSIITAAVCSLYGYTNADSSVCMQKGTQADPLVLADYVGFIGSEYSHISWAINQYNDITFNQQGKDDIEKAGTTKICIREYEHDYLNEAPLETYMNGCYYAEQGGTDNDPKLVVTYTPAVGTIDTDDSGEGYWSKSGDQFDAGEQTYEFTDNKTISLYGEGEAAANIDRGMGGLAQAAMALLT